MLHFDSFLYKVSKQNRLIGRPNRFRRPVKQSPS
nr:MAG TPA: hypothetical protein [Caudoviricetes sp.]DAS45808.1 MAG TPA: hypothetical protein [Caudoviricetes sp.]